MSHYRCSTRLTRRLHLPRFDVVALFAGDGARTMFVMTVDALIGTAVVEVVMRVDGNFLADFRSVARVLEIGLEVEALASLDDGLFAVAREASLGVGRRKLAVDMAGRALEPLVLDGRRLSIDGERGSQRQHDSGGFDDVHDCCLP